MPQDRRPTLADVRAFLLLNPDSHGVDLKKEYPALQLGEARELLARVRFTEGQPVSAPETIAEKGPIPADKLAEVDRNTLYQTVTTIHEALRIASDRLLKQILEVQDGINISKDDTAALASLQKVAAGLVDTYPGLMTFHAEASPGKADSRPKRDDLAAVKAALERKGAKVGTATRSDP